MIDRGMRQRKSIVTSGPSGIDLRISKIDDDFLSEPGTITIAEPVKTRSKRVGGKRPTTASKTQKSINIHMSDTGAFKLPSAVTNLNNT